MLAQIYNQIDTAIKWVDDRIWGLPLIILILTTGIYLTVRLGGLQIRHLPKALRFMVKNEEEGHGEVTSFGALCTALSATIGTGNITGVATAIAAGGPGALFWMVVAAFFGMATKYAEGLLAIKYRTIDKEGHVLGGPFYYIENGMGKNWRWLAKIFAFFGAGVGLFGIGTFTQVNSIASAVKNFFDPNTENAVQMFGNTYSWATVITCIILTVCVGLVVIGGLKRIAKVSEIVVPFMAVLYVVFVLIIMITHITEIPAAIVTIVKSAFTGSALAGGAMGTMVVAMQKGIARGIFSNEAGLGSAPIAAAAAVTKEPVRQGLVSMTGTFIDTIIICTMTGISVVLAGTWNDPNLEGVEITMAAFQKGLPFAPQLHPLSDALSGILCNLLRFSAGITMENGVWNICSTGMKKSSDDLSLAVYSGCIYRTIYDGCGSVEHRRYLQCADGASEPDRTACAQQCGGQRNERLFCEDEIERNQQNPLDLFYDSSYNKETYERNVDEE